MKLFIAVLGFFSPNAKDELAQKPPNTLDLLKIGSTFVVSSILLLDEAAMRQEKNRN